MALQTGDKLGAYEIVSLLGKGGMGEVYRAHDPKLNRDVAIKVLPHALANDADYLARFQREAQTLAALNHPNIATIYGLEANAIVMELVEGATLQGPLPLHEALAMAKQIAEALEAAHDKGIIHRDLKPGNVKVTPEGVVKVLDFGLAKAVNERPTQTGPDSPTLTLRATEAGLILGTAGYMSPEQAAGKTLDRRADIWAFGVVLCELLTGKRMFDGETVTHTLADVVRAPIDLSVIEDPQIRNLIGRCLDRNIKSRLAHIAEARSAIENYSPAKAEPAVKTKTGWRPWAVAAVALLLGPLIGWYVASRPAPPRPLIRLDLEVPPASPLEAGDAGASLRGNTLALSPDGSRLAVTLRGADGKVRIHTRFLHQSQLKPLAGTENAHTPFFSPAGDWIGFFADSKLKKIGVEGGAAVTLCNAPYGVGASWGDDGNIIAALQLGGGLYRIPAAGGSPVPLTNLNSAGETHRWPQILLGSQAVLFTASAQLGAGYDDANIEVMSLRTGERKILHQGGFYGRYIPSADGSGHLVYLHQSTLFAVPFHPGSLAVAGTPTPILEDVGSSVSAGGDFAFAPNGTFVYLAGKASKREGLISWVDGAGKMAQPLHAPAGEYLALSLSPDGKRLAFVKRTAKGGEIWVKDLDRDTPSQLSFLPGMNSHPVWTPDGKIIVFRALGAAAPGLYAIRSDGSGEAKRLTEGKGVAAPYSFSPDGKRLAYLEFANGSNDIFTVPVESEAGPGASGLRLGKPEVFLATPDAEHMPAFSPDGRWLAYQSSESGSFEVYVRPFPGPGGRWLVSAGGARYPLWSRDGRQLFYQTNDGRVMAVDYTAKGDSFAARTPRLWTAPRLPFFPYGSTYDITPDGKRLAAIVADEVSEKLPTHLTFLLNFTDELRRKAAASQ